MAGRPAGDELFGQREQADIMKLIVGRQNKSRPRNATTGRPLVESAQSERPPRDRVAATAAAPVFKTTENMISSSIDWPLQHSQAAAARQTRRRDDSNSTTICHLDEEQAQPRNEDANHTTTTTAD